MFSTLFKRAGRGAAQANAQLGERDKCIGQLEDQLRAQKKRVALVREASGAAWWDMEVDPEDASGATGSFVWSDQMRQLLGFRNEHDFPDAAASWSDRLHPEDAGGTLAAFDAHQADRSGRTRYDIQYRLKCKDGAYRWFARAQKPNVMSKAGRFARRVD